MICRQSGRIERSAPFTRCGNLPCRLTTLAYAVTPTEAKITFTSAAIGHRKRTTVPTGTHHPHIQRTILILRGI